MTKRSHVSFQPDVPPQAKDEPTQDRLVRHEPKPLTKADLKRLRDLAALPDDEIDLSDIPELDESFWAKAERGRFYRPVKQQLTLRLDGDVVDWFKREAGEDGKGYQTRINQALRDYIAAKQRQDKKAG